MALDSGQFFPLTRVSIWASPKSDTHSHGLKGTCSSDQLTFCGSKRGLRLSPPTPTGKSVPAPSHCWFSSTSDRLVARSSQSRSGKSFFRQARYALGPSPRRFAPVGRCWANREGGDGGERAWKPNQNLHGCLKSPDPFARDPWQTRTASGLKLGRAFQVVHVPFWATSRVKWQCLIAAQKARM